MKVLHIFEKMTIGGAETLLLNITKNLDSELIHFDFLVHSDEYGEYETDFLNCGCRVIKQSIKLNGFRNYIKMCKNLFSEYDVIHCHVRKYACIDLPIAKSLKKTTIMHCHSGHSNDQKANNKILMHFYKKYLNKYIDYAFCCSSKSKSFLFLDNRKTINIKNGINHDKFKYNKSAREEIRKTYNIPDNELVIGHVGSFRKVKNQKMLIDVASMLYKESIEFRIFLIGDGELRPVLESYAIQKNVYDKVIFTGNIFNVNKYLSAFDIFLFPSLYEGLPLSVIEAQINGLYVLCSENVDSSVKVSENFDWISVSDSDENLCEIVNKIKKHKNEFRENKISEYNILETVEFLKYFYKNTM